jgi:hypothetical protein
MDWIEDELTTSEKRTVWKCRVNGHYRHRKEASGAPAAICCGQPAVLIDTYEHPLDRTVSDQGDPPAPTKF